MSDIKGIADFSIDSIQKLNKPERVVLEAYAVSCASSYHDAGSDAKAYLNIDARQLRMVQDKLVDKGFLIKGYYYQKDINPAACLNVMVNMLENHPDEAEFFLDLYMKSQRQAASSAVNFINAMKTVIGIDKSQTVKSLSSYYMTFAKYVTKEKA